MTKSSFEDPCGLFFTHAKIQQNQVESIVKT